MEVKIKANRRLTADFWRMEIEWPASLAEPSPGQFVMVRTRNSTVPLWRRPFGINDFTKSRGLSRAFLLYQVVGPTTRDMGGTEKGQMLDLLGPFGRGFDTDGQEHWLVAGGRGIAPLFFLARRLVDEDKVLRVMIGGCTKSHVLQAEELRRMGSPVELATEDGSLGRKGMVTDILEIGLRRISTARRGRIVVSACGPDAMLRRVGSLADEFGVRARLSLDTLMACGQGYCQGCTVKTRSGYSLCCCEGPVFEARELQW
jgi:dihydroorotate dehydrogenase electron transfer subunit